MDSVIFDLDGTLWDTASPCLEAWNSVLKRRRLQLRMALEDIVGLMGKSHPEAVESVLLDLPRETREDVILECYQSERKMILARGGKVYPGVEEGLRKIGSQIPVCLVSNCGSEYLELFFELTGFRKLFADSMCHGASGKPKHENIQTVAVRNNLISPVYAGDTASDQKAAAMAQVEYLHVNYGFGKAEGSCRSFDSFGQLVEHVLS